MTALLVVGMAYLLGSIPFGYLLVRASSGTDIRATGSGNIGATNVMRASRLAGVMTLLLDAGKGTLAVWLALKYLGGPWPVVAALAAVAGHVFPVFLGFRGGKGVATGCGAFILLAPQAMAISLVLFLATVVFTRYVSAGSVVTAALFPVTAWVTGSPPAVVWGCAGAALLILVRHSDNIRRLIRGEEHRFSLTGPRAGRPEQLEEH